MLAFVFDFHTRPVSFALSLSLSLSVCLSLSFSPSLSFSLQIFISSIPHYFFFHPSIIIVSSRLCIYHIFMYSRAVSGLKILSFGHVNPRSGAPGAGGKGVPHCCRYIYSWCSCCCCCYRHWYSHCCCYNDVSCLLY